MQRPLTLALHVPLFPPNRSRNQYSTLSVLCKHILMIPGTINALQKQFFFSDGKLPQSSPAHCISDSSEFIQLQQTT